MAALARHGAGSRDETSPCASWAGSPTGVLELTALPSIDREQWLPMVQETDALLAGGGDVEVISEGHWKLLTC